MKNPHPRNSQGKCCWEDKPRTSPQGGPEWKKQARQLSLASLSSKFHTEGSPWRWRQNLVPLRGMKMLWGP